VENQIQRSLNAAVTIIQARLLRALRLQRKRFDSIPEDDARWGTSLPATHQPLASLPLPLLHEFLMLGLREAILSNKLSDNNALIASLILAEGMPQANVARRLRVSRSAISQRLTAVKHLLRRTLETLDPPHEQ
jgi:DNA-directed RNA polymerase specialized sigma24 family protein